MISNRLWVIGSMLLAVAIVAVGYVVGISPLLATAAQADADRAGVESQNVQQAATLAALKEQFAGIATIQAALDEKRKSIPSDADYSEFLGELAADGETHGVTITDITVSDAVAYAIPVSTTDAPPVAPEAAETDATADAATSEAPAAAAAPTAPAPTDVAPIANSSLVTSENFVVIPLSVSVSGDFDKMMSFVDSLQTGDDRLVFVSDITFSQDTTTGAYTGDFGGFVFVLTDSTVTEGAQTPESTDASVAGIELN